MDAAILMTIGRVVFGLFFVVAGIRNFIGFRQNVGRPTCYGFALPNAALAAGFVLQLVAGALLVLNVAVVPAALALIAFLIVATALYHNALTFPKADRALHIYLTLVNITLASGLLMVMAGAGL